MKKILQAFLFFLPLLTAGAVSAQDSMPVQIPTDRILFHEKVDRQQARLSDPRLKLLETGHPEIDERVREALIDRVDSIQIQLEEDSLLNGNSKKKYLRGLENMLAGYIQYRDDPDFPRSMADSLVTAFEQCMALDRENASIEPVIDRNSYGIGTILSDCFIYPTENIGLPAARLDLIRKYCRMHPDDILRTLSQHPGLPFMDSLILVAAHHDIRRLYDYATIPNELGAHIRNHPDSLVSMVARMANSRSGQIYFPFIDDLLKHKLSFETIDSAKDNEEAYFSLMVRTRIGYFSQELPPTRDTALGMAALTDMMSRKAREYFVNDINALHAVEDENVRFRRLEGLSAQELYYIAVLTEDEIYTSSFVKGVYPRIFQRMEYPRADSLIMSVHGDYFRKFIKMCAAYNTLNDLLARMDKRNDSLLMKAFVIGLEKTDDMEQAVDVADSYSSIMEKNPELARFILEETKWNYIRSQWRKDRKGMTIYHLLNVLFESADSSRKVNLSEQLGIPPVYSVSYNSLRDDSGRIVMQVFFYGDVDKDGQKSFASFMSSFEGKPQWKISRNSEWVKITNTRDKDLLIFANLPLYGENDPEETAINHLCAYLAARNLKPSIFVHRGHSFHVKSTMRRISSSARIVILGSCGGYNNINEVLSRSSDAHIISSKQTGTMQVNEPIIQEINQYLAAGRGIDWIGMWRDLSARFSHGSAKEKFDDYIPPYENLGAIFIKAYRRAMRNP